MQGYTQGKDLPNGRLQASHLSNPFVCMNKKKLHACISEITQNNGSDLTCEGQAVDSGPIVVEKPNSRLFPKY